MPQSTTKAPLREVLREVRKEIGNRPPQDETRSEHISQPTINAPGLAMPDYVEHRQGATEIGRLAAEGLVREYEAAAKEIESVGADLVDRLRQCEAMTRDAFAVTEELSGVARRYREEAKRVFEHIESCSTVVADALKTCTDLKDKIAAPATRTGVKANPK